MGEDGGLATFKNFTIMDVYLSCLLKNSPSSLKLEGFLMETLVGHAKPSFLGTDGSY
jgi:hypothetical protein